MFTQSSYDQVETQATAENLRVRCWCLWGLMSWKPHPVTIEPAAASANFSQDEILAVTSFQILVHLQVYLFSPPLSSENYVLSCQ